MQGDAYLRDIPPLPDIHLFTIGPFNFPSLFTLPSVKFNPITLAAPDQNVDLGNLLANEIAPTVQMDTIPSNGTEGNPISLGVVGNGPGGSLSPCGTSGLTFAWAFDDGGTATGQNVQHTFAENYLGGVPHTGSVVVTDPTGQSTTLKFAVPVADAPLTLACGTPAVSLQAFSGTVASLHDGDPAAPLSDFTATVDWGDGSSSSGTVSGSSGDYLVAGSHTYASTGYFPVKVHVDDVGGSTADVSPCTVLVFAFAPGGGSFVVGNGSSAINACGHLLGCPVVEAERPDRRRRSCRVQGLRALAGDSDVRRPGVDERPGQQPGPRRRDRCPRTWASSSRARPTRAGRRWRRRPAHRRREDGPRLRAQRGPRRNRPGRRDGLLSPEEVSDTLTVSDTSSWELSWQNFAAKVPL